MDQGELSSAMAISKIIGRMKDSLYSAITEKDILGKKDAAAVNKLGLDYLKDLKLEWMQALRGGFSLGASHALGEVKAVVGSQFAVGTAEAVGNIPPAKILDYFTQRAFWLTGTMKADILKNVQAQLLDGIRSGLSNAEVIRNLETYFSKYTVNQLTGAGGSMPIQNIPGRIETIVRTNYNDAYNQGRLTMFQAPDVAPYIAAYQYSAIIDDRTTDVCRILDGKVYRADNPIWAQITPPNHYNCRSLLIPVFVGEDFVESDPPSIMPDKGFGGTL
jgi:SPP1 gp7 family putative phage head morphogenesis protein